MSDSRRSFAAPATALLAAVAAFCISLSLPFSFWIIDEAVNFLQGEAVHSAPLRLPPELPYPGADLAGAHASSLRPVPHQYGTFSDGRLYAQYSPSLALAALPFRAALGVRGYAVLQALSLGIAVLLLGSILRERGFGAIEGPAVVLLCTPILFFSQTFWGHLPAIALCAAAWTAFRKGWRIPCTALVLAAGLLREECLVFLPAAAFVAVPGRKTGRGASVLHGSLIVAASVVLFCTAQKLLTGSWIGTHLQASGTETDLYGFASTGIVARKIFVLRTALLSCLPYGSDGVSALCGPALWGLWSVSRGDSRPCAALSILGAAVSAALALAPALNGLGLFSLLELKHPLVVFPCLWLAGRPSRAWLVPGAAFVATLLAMDPMHALDVAWGSRLLMPSLLMFAVAAARPGRAGRRAVAAAGLVTAAVSLCFLAAKRERSAELVEAARSHGGAVIATSWELPCEFAALQAEGTPVLFADSTAEFVYALQVLAPLNPVVACPSGGMATASRAASVLGLDLVPAASVRFDPLLEAVILETSPGSHENP